MVLALSSGAMLAISGVLLAIGVLIVVLAMRQPGDRAPAASAADDWVDEDTDLEAPPSAAPARVTQPRAATSAPRAATAAKATGAAKALKATKAPAAPRGTAAAPPHAARRASLRAIVDRMIHVGDEETVHLDRRSGAFVTLADQLRALIESGDEIDDPVDFTAEQIAAIRQRMKSGEMVMLPTKAQTREFELQERFIHELPEDGTKENMLEVMRGQPGYRSFEGTVKRLGLEKRSRALRDTAFAQIATDWCGKHGIAFEADVAAPGPASAPAPGTQGEPAAKAKRPRRAA